MIDQNLMAGDTRRGDRESDLLNALVKINGSRQTYKEGGETKPLIDLAEFLKLGMTLSNLSEAERESVRLAVGKMLDVPKK
tara:strand:+ start:125 stop:367 length:243 start_codon:yes stop_codon:yes gene_type:complete